jgi:hypothetical protein
MTEWKYEPLTGSCPTCGALVYDVKVDNEHYAQYTCFCFLKRAKDGFLSVCPVCKVTLKLEGPNEYGQYESSCPMCKRHKAPLKL